MSTGNNKFLLCEEKILYYTCYAHNGDITFVMKDRLINDNCVTSECLGWYRGEPDPKMSQEVVEGKIANKAELEPDVHEFQEVE